MNESSEIGKTAGSVWSFLHEHGKSSVSAVERGVAAPKRRVHMALGWLAREGKVGFTEERNSLQVSLST
jgi:Winged helix-turn-helix domain (DUF2582)